MDAPGEVMYKEGDHEEHLEIEEAGEVLPKTKEVGTEHPSTPVIIIASLPDPSPPEASHALIVSIALGSSSIYLYTWLKPMKYSQAMIGLPTPD